jgi:hypothetical protein
MEDVLLLYETAFKKGEEEGGGGGRRREEGGGTWYRHRQVENKL